MIQKNRTSAQLLWTTATVVWGLCGAAAQAQGTETAAMRENTSSLLQIFEATWTRQPEAVALQTRREAASAQQRATSAWTPEPPALEFSNKSDRLYRNQGAREIELGVSVPLWLPGERSRGAALASAESAAVESRAAAARLRVAASVREAWWQLHRARIDAYTARSQLDSTQRIAADVVLRTKAGDLARADQHQADGAVAGAQANVAQADATLAAARQQLRALAGFIPTFDEAGIALQEPEPGIALIEVESHASLQELKDRAAVAEKTAALTASRSRANPELVLSTARDRGSFGESAQKTITLGVRIPFGSGPRQDSRIASATAEATEAQAQLALERERLMAEREAARVRVDGLRTQLEATERRAQLARESRSFFDKSFRLGETDLPTRLRIEAEATEAERQASRTRIELSAAVSAWRQALGLLPQ